MVYTGKPSTGCHTCRKRRIRCDERRPVCGQCVKSKRDCLGYRDPNEFMFRNETSTVEARVIRKERDRIASQAWRPGLNSNGYSLTALQSVPAALGEDFEKLALNYFISEFVLVPRHVESVRGYMEYLIPVYTAAAKGSPIFPAISAAALGSLAHKQRSSGLFFQSQVMYGQACARLQEAIADPVDSRSNDTLMAVLLLSIYDTMATTRATLFQWCTHADGAAALVKHRGEEIKSNPIGRRLYWSVQSQTLINCVIKCEPMEPFLDWTDLWSQPMEIDLKEKAANRLTMMAARLPALRYAALKWLRAPMSSKVLLNVLNLKSNALALDEYISAWPETIPKSWRVRDVGLTEGQEGDPEEWEFWPGPVHAYYDLWVTNVWNSYRTIRIFCNYIILNCCERLHPVSELELILQYRAAKSLIQEMNDDICHSVPYQLGHATPMFDVAEGVVYASNDDIQSENDATWTRPQSDCHRRAAESFGGWFLSWNLFVAIGCLTISNQQRLWIKGRLCYIADRYGVGQAKILALLGIEPEEDERGMTIVDMRPPPFTELPNPGEAMLAHKAESDELHADEKWKASQTGQVFERWKREFLAGFSKRTTSKPLWEAKIEDIGTLRRSTTRTQSTKS